MSGTQPTEKQPIPEHLLEYRKFLVAAEQKSQEDFDKAVLTLSGGALAISFTFLKEVVGTSPVASPALLLGAWLCWAASTLSVLCSYFLSHLALRRAIGQVDDGTIYSQKPGGEYAKWTARLNAGGAVLFVLGVCAITWFAGVNLDAKGGNVEQQTTTKGATVTGATAPSAATAGASSSGASSAARGASN